MIDDYPGIVQTEPASTQSLDHSTSNGSTQEQPKSPVRNHDHEEEIENTNSDSENRNIGNASSTEALNRKESHSD